MNSEVKCKVPLPTGSDAGVQFVVYNGIGMFRLNNGQANFQPADFTDGYTLGREDLAALKIQSAQLNRH